MALVYSSSGKAYPAREVTHILGESNGTAQFVDTSSLLMNTDILSVVSDSGDESQHAVVGPAALRAYYEAHKTSGPQGVRGYQGYQGISESGGSGERGYQGWRGYQGVAGTAGSDYWTINDPSDWSPIGNGQLYARYNVNAIAFFQNSDDRMKKKLEDIKGALKNIEKIPTFKFKFKGQRDERIHLGSSAQSLLDVVPEVVTESKEGRLAVTYPELSVYTLAALKELVALLKEKQII